jgi:hypothetical protein
MPESREPQGLRLTNDDSFHKKRTGFGSHHVLKWFEFPNDSRGMSGGLKLGGDPSRSEGGAVCSKFARSALRMDFREALLFRIGALREYL